MKRVGLFLGSPPSAGGVFQYSRSVLDALASLDRSSCSPIAAFVSEDWAPIVSGLGVEGRLLRSARAGENLARLLMALRVPGPVCRAFGGWLNPLGAQLVGLGCDAIVFPAQDAIGYQTPVRAIGAIHDLMHRYEPQFPEVSATGRFGLREQRFKGIVEHSTAVLVDSRVGRDHAVESYGADPSRVHPLPYVAPSSVVDAAERPDFDQAYRLPPKFLLYPAQFWAHKNHLRLLDAVQASAGACPDVQLVLCGGLRRQFDVVRRHALDLGIGDRVRFAGYVSDADLGGFYRRARALVMPTFFGPTNIPPLEAFSLGCPVLISRIYAMPEQCRDAALYFDPRSAEDMAAAITRIWTDDALASELVAKGRERAAELSQRHFNARFAQILAEVLGSVDIRSVTAAD